ncbi:MAG: GAF domain-containing protein, partial [Zetaproteobacteria bacterium]
MEASAATHSAFFEAMFQASPLAVVVLDRDGRVKTWNPAAERIFGWSESEVLGRRPPFVPEDKREDFLAVRRRELAGEHLDGVELHRQRKDGTPVDVRLWTAPLRDAQGRVSDVLGILEDVTDRNHAQAALSLRTRQLDAIRSVTLEITQPLELSRLLDLIHRRAVELVGVRSGVLYVWDEGTREMVSTVRYGYSADLPPVRFRLGEGVAGAVAERREGLIVNDFRTSPYTTPWLLEHTTHTAVLAEPLLYRDRLLGVVSLSNTQLPDRLFTDEDQELLRFFAAQAAIAIQNAEHHQSAERQRREAEIVGDLARGINASLNLDSILRRVTEGARELTGADLAYIALRESETDAVVFRYGAGARYERYQNLRVEPEKGVGGRVLATGEPFRTSDYAEDVRITKDYLAVTSSEGVVAELAVPVRAEGRIEGLLYVSNRSQRPFTDADERTAQQLADHAAVAIRNARLHGIAVRRAQQLESLNTVTKTVVTELNPHRVTRRVLEGVHVLFPSSASVLFEQIEGAETLRVAASLGLRQSPMPPSFRLRAGEGLAGIATATRQPVVTNGIPWDPRFANRSWAAAEGLVSGIVLPLVYGDGVAGVLGVFLRRSHTFVADEVDLLLAFAAQCAIALENARLFEQVSVGREQLSKLTQEVVSVQEEERRRLSRELHDHAGQALTALRIGLDLIREDLPADAVALRRRMGDTAALAASIADQVRGVSQSLRPPALETLGLNAALDGLCRDFSRRTEVIVTYRGCDIPGLPDHVGIHLYRLVQEALTNVGRHAHVDSARVVLGHKDDEIRVTVEDEGAGFDAASASSGISPEHTGLIGMRERV